MVVRPLLDRYRDLLYVILSACLPSRRQSLSVSVWHTLDSPEDDSRTQARFDLFYSLVLSLRTTVKICLRGLDCMNGIKAAGVDHLSQLIRTCVDWLI